MPTPTNHVWVITHCLTDGDEIDVLGVFSSEEGKDQFLLKLIKVGVVGKVLNLNQVKSHLVRMG